MPKRISGERACKEVGSRATCAGGTAFADSGSMIRVDLHLHSSYSHDGWASPCEVVERAIAAGLDKIAITDHDEIAGALEARSRYPGQVIVGEEINCGCGTHLIGLFLTERIVPGLSVEETAERIRDQGGVVYAPHPFAYARRPAWHAEQALAVADVVEGFNSRAFFPPWNRKASAAARQRVLPHLASSDAHFPWELGRAYTQMPSFSYAKGFLDSAPYCRSIGLRTGTPFVHVASVLIAQVRRLTGWQPGKTRSSHTSQPAAANQRSVERQPPRAAAGGLDVQKRPIRPQHRYLRTRNQAVKSQG